MNKRKLPFVFHFTNVKTKDSTTNLKLLHLEYLAYWKEHRLLSNKRIILPPALEYQFQISGEISDHIFEVTDPTVTEKDFLKAGFVKDKNFSNFITQNAIRKM